MEKDWESPIRKVKGLGFTCWLLVGNEGKNMEPVESGH